MDGLKRKKSFYCLNSSKHINNNLMLFKDKFFMVIFEATL